MVLLPNSWRRLLPALVGLLPLSAVAHAQTPKELRTKPGVSVVVVNLINPRPDCSSNPGPVMLPSLRQRPASGIIQMQIVVSDVAAAGNCPARKVPTIALFYTPRKGFSGVDQVQIEVDTENRTTLLSYRIMVGATEEPL
ncbi:hypothetical protein [Bradyrhizobium guangzhouense]|uniref:hypothetical protein n=1 Tax=Bradyrhizobium guangzhouense TaxID=1325095 RepID=UPI001009D60F|nr:hypothetical protein [Bradyrhizobium guangzhouense]RXH10130.1 hypothetical protein EAS54_32290 [Bradyrhizobium guangzhouense]